MPSPLNVPRRPRWRYEPIQVAGRKIIPAAPTDEDRTIVLSRLTRNETNGNRSTQHEDSAASAV